MCFKFIIVKENKKTFNCKDNINKESTKVPLCGVYLAVKYHWNPDPTLTGKCTPQFSPYQSCNALHTASHLKRL